ncbi:MAG: type II toxin-antitoxin system RelB/DinJ family antitoxin [Defluviitaleaceae bacterium]|nr:type II toxin-antitoxin system RelB/DinJ family antitoxin [Defluviitaleaceae bacterium]
MGAINVTVRIEENTKREFDAFCENVGINITTAFNMFIKATLRTRELPFAVTDAITPITQKQARKEFGKVIREIQAQSVINGTDKITLDEINDIISECRQETSVAQ